MPGGARRHLRNRKSVNLPDTRLSISAVGPENREDVIREISFASENEVEYIAASFVQSADDIVKMREILTERNVEIPIIAKIENKAGVANLDEIIEAADGLMVARGDLGVELPLADVPGTQKMMIRKTVTNGKPVITATQMLASMEWNPKPTRAEASDVANAILDGSSAVMLSGETAVGKYPVEAVRTMATLAQRAESQLRRIRLPADDPAAPVQCGDRGGQPGGGGDGQTAQGGGDLQPDLDRFHLAADVQASPGLPDPGYHRRRKAWRAGCP